MAGRIICWCSGQHHALVPLDLDRADLHRTLASHRECFWPCYRSWDFLQDQNWVLLATQTTAFCWENCPFQRSSTGHRCWGPGERVPHFPCTWSSRTNSASYLEPSTWADYWRYRQLGFSRSKTTGWHRWWRPFVSLSGSKASRQHPKLYSSFATSLARMTHEDHGWRVLPSEDMVHTPSTCQTMEETTHCWTRRRWHYMAQRCPTGLARSTI